MANVLSNSYSAERLPTQKSVDTSAVGTFSFGKYREIIIAVGFFLLFDLGVLILNFYTSFQISQDAVGINLSGRQRMLSQRTAKAMLSVEAARNKALPAEIELAELKNAAGLFDTSLKGFQNGGTVPGGDGKPVLLKAAEGAKAAEILANAQSIWTVYQEKLAPVLKGSSTDVELQIAGDYARANNLKLLGLMNELTTALESVASERANTLRRVQTVGIVLALLNFAFILFKFLRRLRTSDAAIEAANEENHEILTSVREGLFLMTPDFKLGSQLSDSSHKLFDRILVPGESFFDLLAPLVSTQSLKDARDYVELLFSPHIKESLVQGINPLSEVEVRAKNKLGQDVKRHLSFYFNRVQDAGAVRHLLVTVQDISERVALEQKLKAERQRSQNEFSMLLRAFDTDPTTLRQFVVRSEESLLEINNLLRSTSTTLGDQAIRTVIDQAFRRVHALKGDAGSLGLETLMAQANLFEGELQRIKRFDSTNGNMGDALLSLPMQLEELLAKVAALKSILGVQRQGSVDKTTSSINESMVQFAQSIAKDSGKEVQVFAAIGSLCDLSTASSDLVREISLQLIRNAVVHGIEAPHVRLGLAKEVSGKIEIQLTRTDTEWCLRVRDDGAGLNASRVRQILLDKAWYTASQLENFSEQQIVEHIFKPGFSTTDMADLHSGRGVGLDLVQTNVKQLGGGLQLTSTSGKYTEFRIRFAV
jgi:HPt (histidine-containing phosphotransfer) domain-containing protein